MSPLFHSAFCRTVTVTLTWWLWPATPVPKASLVVIA
jgi:hypothetical protein